MDEKRKTKVVVAGAGPAGSVCAYLLHKAGVDCILLDRAQFPRDKICGGGLTHKSYEWLEEVYPNLKYDYNSVRRIKLTVNNTHTCEFEAEKEIRIVRRKVFDHELLKQYIGAGGKFLNEGLHDVSEADGRIVVTLASGSTIECEYLVGADGANSRVRKHLTKEPVDQVLALEQYMDKRGDNKIDVALSNDYSGGYYYRFPNDGFDVVGFGDHKTTIEGFRQMLSDMGIEETKLRGAYVPLSTNYPLHKHIILIGDAGGFANRVTCEGLFYAFRTAQNAKEAIVSGRPFSEVNALYFKKKRHEDIKGKVFYSKTGLAIVGWLCRWPNIVKWCFDRNV